ncbi:MAG: hypothetical protein HY704_15815 [Gemmatimonadetes bacterium]|nr:hypothetical protein [Gemmatimonadota bacterium]
MSVRVRLLSLALALAAWHQFAARAARAAPASPADSPEEPGRLRVGISLGGTHRLGLAVEVLDGSNAVEFSLGTFRFDVITLSVTARRYSGSGPTRPYVGAGLWTILAFPGDDFGYLALARLAPGIDWKLGSEHYAGLEASLSYALAVKRPDPQDKSPLRRHFLPLPAAYYKFRPRG